MSELPTAPGPAGSAAAVVAVIVTDVTSGLSKLLAPGQTATFGRTGASTPLDFRLHDSPFLSRRAGQLQAQPHGVLVVSTQRGNGGGVSVLAPSGIAVATLSYGGQFLCSLTEFRVRIRIDAVGHFDLQVTQGPSGATAPSPTTDPDDTHTSTWALEVVLDPPEQLRWQTALAIACALTVHGPPHRPSTDSWAGTLPTSAMVLRWVNAHLGTSFGAHWLSDRWDQALAGLGMRPPDAGSDKLPALVREVLAGARLSSTDLLEVAERLRTLPT